MIEFGHDCAQLPSYQAIDEAQKIVLKANVVGIWHVLSIRRELDTMMQNGFAEVSRLIFCRCHLFPEFVGKCQLLTGQLLRSEFHTEWIETDSTVLSEETLGSDFSGNIDGVYVHEGIPDIVQHFNWIITLNLQSESFWQPEKLSFGKIRFTLKMKRPPQLTWSQPVRAKIELEHRKGYGDTIYRRRGSE